MAACLFLMLSGLARAAEGGVQQDAIPVPEGESALRPPDGAELVKRTATSETYALPGGEREVRIHQEPVRYRDADGAWRPIEEGLEPGPGSSIVNGDNRFDVRLPGRLGAAPVRVDKGQEWVAYRLLGSESEAGVVAAEAATYESAEGGTSFEFSTLANGVKEDIEISDASQPNAYSFELSASAGVTAALVEDGSIEFRKEDQLIASMPPPTVSDSASAPSSASAVSYDLSERTEGGWLLRVEVDPEWLAQPERAWPVVIDPTVLAFSSPFYSCYLNTADRYQTQCQSQGVQRLYASAFAEYKRRSTIFFNINGAIPSGVAITSATIGLNALSTSSNTVGVQLRALSQPWTEAASWMCSGYPSGCSPWTTAGGYFNSEGSEVLTSQREQGSQPGWWIFQVKSLVQKWVDGALPSYGVIAKQSDESCCSNRVVEWASGAWPNATQRPYLSVTYYPKAPSSSKVTSPTEGIRTGRRLKLKAAWGTPGIRSVSYQWKPTYAQTPGANTWQTIPANLVKDSSGKTLSSWPLVLSAKEKEAKSNAPLYFDAASASAEAERNGESIYVRAILEGESGSIAAEGYTDGVNALVDPQLGNARDAAVPIGPGKLDLLTGSFTVSATDVSIATPGGTLEFARSISNGDEKGATAGVLGGGWRPTVPVEEGGGSAWHSAYDETVEEGGSYTVITDLEGGELPFEWTGSAYAPLDEAPGWSLIRNSASRLTLRDPSGSSTVFDKNPADPEYLPSEVSTPGGPGNKTKMAYELLGESSKRLKTLIAPTMPSVDCEGGKATTAAGCRALSFSYEKVSTSSGPVDRLSKITYNGPANGLGDDVVVAQYAYDGSGNLSQVWDPRVSSPLKTSYSYVGWRLKTVTPPGQEPWTMSYVDGEQWQGQGFKGQGRLASVSRASLLSNPSTATTSIAYEVPTSGSGSPYDLSPGTIAGWGQEDIPTDATAIFPPDEVPSSSPPSSYARAILYYMDAEGNLVNTATPSGAGTSVASVSTVETDEHGNIYRELTPQNRLRALAAAETAVKSRELDTHRTFNADGTEMVEEWGPTHETRFKDGTTAPARLHKVVQYQNPEPPAGYPKYHLPTLETTGASWAGGVDKDVRVAKTLYDWGLRKPIDTITDPGGLDIHHRVSYDESTGAPTLIRQPKSSGTGDDAYTTKIIYYAAVVSAPYRAECSARADLAGLPCVSMPAAQPGSSAAPEVPETYFAAYSPLGRPAEVVERLGSANNFQPLRTTRIQYDQAGRRPRSGRKVAESRSPAPPPPITRIRACRNKLASSARREIKLAKTPTKANTRRRLLTTDSVVLPPTGMAMATSRPSATTCSAGR